MMTSDKLKITPITASKIQQFKTLENIPFGKYSTDYMLRANYEDGKWNDVEILPYQPISIHPSLAALHYGQSVFEGMKAFKNATDNKRVGIFRLHDHHERMKKSAHRLQMPEIPAHIFVDGMKELISMEKEWVPSFDGHSLYIRPFMFASDHFLGVRPSSTYTFMIICTPASSYYSKAINVLVEDKYARAAHGGVGSAKVAGNYAAALYPTQLAMQKGFDQVLWTSAEDHCTVQEVGTMNIFFVFENRVVTPSLEEGTILDGITRKSIIHLLKKENIPVSEEKLSVNDIISMYKKGKLKEIFGTGTAVVVNPVAKLQYKNEVIDLSEGNRDISNKMSTILNDIRYGRTTDTEKWMTWVE